jgi:hypothetical protein
MATGPTRITDDAHDHARDHGLDRDGRGLDERGVLASARAAMLAERRAGCRLLEAAALWADLNPSESLLTPEQRLEEYGEKAVLFGGPGTPDVAESAAGTLGVEVGLNPDQARALIADALDARDRMPEIWQQVRAGRVRRDTVHRVAIKTRHLTPAQVGVIDGQIAATITRLGPGQRLDNLLDAQIMRVDRERLEEQAAAAVHDRYVQQGRPDREGMTDLFIHTTTADAQAAMAAITDLAHQLKASHLAGTLPAAVPVRDAHTSDGGPSGRDGSRCLDEWRAIAAQLLQTNPALAWQIQLQSRQPDLLDHAADQAMRELAEQHELAHDDQPSDGARQTVMQEIIDRVVERIDLTRLQPAATLHVHIVDQALDTPARPADPQARIARVEGLGPRFLDTVRAWLGEACTVKLQPVIDTGNQPAIDRYEYTPAMREAILTRSPASVFPWSNSLNRGNDIDHTSRYLPPDRGGPPGQTGLHNAGPLTRREHRYKTFGPITVHQPDATTHVWRTRHGRILIVNPSGTFDLGTSPYAQAIWAATIEHTRTTWAA